ncbi:hypothetical protein Tco_1248278 [Tanacetum coccineum]
MTRMMYNWIRRIKLEPREDPNRGVSNFTGRIKGMHVFVGNFTYGVDFMIVEDISSIIDPRLSHVVLAKPFIEISNMIHELSLGVVKFTNGINEIAYKMPHKLEQYDSLSDLEKEPTKKLANNHQFIAIFSLTLSTQDLGDLVPHVDMPPDRSTRLAEAQDSSLERHFST